MSEQLTIQEIIDHCNRKLERELPGSIFHREHEAVKAYLMELLQLRSMWMDAEKIAEWLRQDKVGRLEVLPCKPGDTVYTVDKIRGAYELIEWRAVEISIDSHCRIVVLEHPHHGIKTRRGCDFEAFGVAAFLERGTAIRALRNRKTGITQPEVENETT